MIIPFPWIRRDRKELHAASRPQPAHAALPQLLDYWQGLRGSDGSLPQRAAIDPQGFADALAQCFIGERIAGGLLRLCVAGRALNVLAGLEPKGLPLSALFTAEARPQLSAILAEVFDHPARAEITLSASRGLGRPPLQARLLLLPLRGDSGACDVILGCLSVEQEASPAMRRFDISHSICHRLVRAYTAPMPETAAQPPVIRQPQPEPAAAIGAPEHTALKPEAERVARNGATHLRLVYSV